MPTPAADLLGFGQSSGPHFQLDYSTASGAGITTITQTQIAASTGISQIMYASDDNSMLMLRSDVDVDVIASNGYPRTEFREKNTDGTTHRAFDPTTGDHSIQLIVRPMHLPPIKPSVVLCQMHDNAGDVIELVVQPRSDFASTGKTEVVCRVNGTSSGIPKVVSDYVMGSALSLKMRVGAIASGATGWEVYYDDMNTPKIKSLDSGMPAMSTSGANSYFKFGCYLQTKYTGSGTGGLETDINEYGEVGYRNVLISHNGEATPYQVVNGVDRVALVGNIRSGTVVEANNAAGTGMTVTPGLPGSLTSISRVYAVVRVRRSNGSSTPSTPTSDTGWTRLLNITTAVPPTDLVSHSYRLQFWVYNSSGVNTPGSAPNFVYSSSSTSDVMSAQCFAVDGTKFGQAVVEIIDGATPSTLALGATSTSTIGDTNSLASSPIGSLILALFAHEFNVTSGGVATTSGDGLTWTEVGEGVGTTTSFQAWANDVAPAPSGGAIAAKSTTATVTSGKSANLLFALTPANIRGDGFLMAA